VSGLGDHTFAADSPTSYAGAVPRSLARPDITRLRSCSRCGARRWVLVETRDRIGAGCLQCGLVTADVMTGSDDCVMTTEPRRRARRRDGVRWIAHAGLAPAHSGRTPSHASLDRALQIRVDTIELDACVTSDDYIVVRHDVRVGGGRRVHEMTLQELRRVHPQTMTLPEAVEHLGASTEILVDVKDARAIAPLVRWIRDCGRRSGLVVCCPNPRVLLELRTTTPAVERWQSLPSVGSTRRGAIARVAGALAQACVEGRAGSVAAELRSAGGELITSPRDAASRVVGSPWRRELPNLLGRLTGSVGAAGLSVDHRLVSPELCREASARGLRLVAWTVNAADHLARVVDSGVREVTTDDVVRMRLALAGIAH
jgi:glycerophosphoryl diester phosphodiesterase